MFRGVGCCRWISRLPNFTFRAGPSVRNTTREGTCSESPRMLAAYAPEGWIRTAPARQTRRCRPPACPRTDRSGMGARRKHRVHPAGFPHDPVHRGPCVPLSGARFTAKHSTAQTHQRRPQTSSGSWRSRHLNGTDSGWCPCADIKNESELKTTLSRKFTKSDRTNNRISNSPINF